MATLFYNLTLVLVILLKLIKKPTIAIVAAYANFYFYNYGHILKVPKRRNIIWANFKDSTLFYFFII